ncbi:MAG: DegT/DnrJ/EryC1/StrS family aminotransferase [Ignavibacteria bacterium]|jgi:dTDP-4-amino-4,6-dideoxygalactose transaminase|nr:DegT/DnrJ/EryC1/StrS family aminotransferase [Ignavibacteria bacterium]
MKVPLLDLKAQYKTIKKELDDALLRVAESQYFILGPEVEKLEKNISDYLNCRYAVGVSSGTDALLIALMAVDIKPGDEVIIPDYSFFATAGVVSRLNAVPVFADIDIKTYNIDVNKIESKITERTKAVIPVHLYGQSADMGGINEIARKHGLKVIEDGAQAIGSQYSNGKYAGTTGDIGCFSFFPSKNLGCFGDGGIVTTNDEKLFEKLHILRVHGSKPKYYHKVIGGNFRLDAIQAAVLNVKLPHLDSWSEKRRKNADLYNELFISKGLSSKTGVTQFTSADTVLLPEPVYKNSGHQNYHIYNQYIIRVGKRDELRKFLAEREIGTEIYYPVPFHKQECFSEVIKTNNYKADEFIFSETAANETIALPIFPELTDEQIKFVVNSIKDFFAK